MVAQNAPNAEEICALVGTTSEIPVPFCNVANDAAYPARWLADVPPE